MSNVTLGLPDDLRAYLLRVGVREPAILKRLREETAALPQHNMQIAPEQGALMALLVQISGARRCIELGTFTGYSSLAVALALPPDGRIVCCDVSREWTDVAARYWAEAGVAAKVDLRIGPALATLDALLADGAADTFDFAFLDADKLNYSAYAERLIRLLRSGGLLAVDNVLRHGTVADPAANDPDTLAIRALNEMLVADDRVDVAMVPIADGLTLARKRG